MLAPVKPSILPWPAALALTALPLVVSSACKKKDEPPPAPAAAAPTAASQGAPAEGAMGGSALAGFEGEVEVLLRAAPDGKQAKDQILHLHVKGDRLRMDVPPGHEAAGQLGGAPRVVFDVKAQKMTAIVDERKIAVTMDVARFAEQAKAMTGSRPSAQPAGQQPKLTRTSRTDTVAGYRCEEWDLVTPGGETSQMCIASEAAPFFAFPTATLPPDQAWAKEVFDGRHLPLRFVTKSKDGAEEARVEVRKLEKKAVDESAFAIPAGYQVMDTAELTQRMLGAIPSALAPGLPTPPAGATGLPQGLALPPGVQLPKGVQIPPEAQRMLKEMQERAKAAQQPK
jgi:hypothetical protein